MNLTELSLSELKTLATELNVTPTLDKRKKVNWINAIEIALASQNNKTTFIEEAEILEETVTELTTEETDILEETVTELSTEEIEILEQPVTELFTEETEILEETVTELATEEAEILEQPVTKLTTEETDILEETVTELTTEETEHTDNKYANSATIAIYCLSAIALIIGVAFSVTNFTIKFIIKLKNQVSLTQLSKIKNQIYLPEKNKKLQFCPN